MAYQSWDGVWCKGHQCRIKLGRGEGHYVAYPEPMALCDVHFQEWKDNNKAAKEAVKQKKTKVLKQNDTKVIERCSRCCRIYDPQTVFNADMILCWFCYQH